MRIDSLRVSFFRRFVQAEQTLHPRLNVFVGPNAAGKTSLLEAVYVACRGQSFRARKLEEAIQDTQSAANVSLQIAEQLESPLVSWSAGFQRGELQVLRLGQAVTRREQAAALPLVLVDRQLHRVFEDAPIYRRRYVDWGLFYVEQSFYGQWRRYERALAQRNAALRSKAGVTAIQVWDVELAASGSALHALRLAHCEQLQRQARHWIQQLLNSERFTLELRPGWDQSQPLAVYLAANLERDRALGYTVGGPHRAELRVRFEEHEARSFVSRGQQKMLAVAMTLAQASLVAEVTTQFPVFLLDDIEAELSIEWQRKLVAALMNYPGQSLATSLEWKDSLAPKSAIPPKDFAVFHVEHGRISPRS